MKTIREILNEEEPETIRVTPPWQAIKEKQQSTLEAFVD